MNEANEGTMLWSNARISDEIFRIKQEKGYPLEAAIASMPHIIRDDYEAALAERDARIKELEQEVRELEESCHSLGAALSGTESAWEEIESLMLGEDA
jgi:polyhydroxyalkanoate synthesis regulator phasin